MVCGPLGGLPELSEPAARPRRPARDAAARRVVPGCVPKLQCLPVVSAPVGGAVCGDSVAVRRAHGPPGGPPGAPEPPESFPGPPAVTGGALVHRGVL